MSVRNVKARKKRFTRAEKKILKGIAHKIGIKRGCSAMYVRYIINEKRGIDTILAKAIFQDLKDLLTLLKPLNNKKKK